MSATLINLPAMESHTPMPTDDLQFAKCDCCGLTEECTAAYIEHIRERYKGKWICGLCTDAVHDEVVRSNRLITTEEALNKHTAFRKKFSSSANSPPNPAVNLISAMRQILRRSIDSPSSMPSSPTKREANHAVFIRSGSCIPAMTLSQDSDCQSCPSIGEAGDEEVAVERKDNLEMG